MQVVKPTLFDLKAITTPDYEEGATIRERWWAFHSANLHVYDMLRDMALELKSRGIRHYGIAALYEALRYRYAVQTGGDSFKLNNSYRAYYSRFLMAREPLLVGFFETRRQTASEQRQDE
jgi:hypothetical protein